MKQSLVIGALFFTSLVCGVFSLGMVVTFEAVEESLFTPRLEQEVEEFLAQYDVAPQIIDIPRKNFKVYLDPVGDRKSLPVEFRNLELDAGEIVLGGKGYYLVRAERGVSDFYFFFDESHVEAVEVLLFVVMITVDVILILLGLLVSIAIANRIVNPLEELVHQIDVMEDEGGETIHLSESKYYPTEIVILTNTLEHFRRRIISMLSREQEFSSNVSHELRTPLMGIRGAVEILEMGAKSEQEATDLYRRIGRNCHYMSVLTESLLILVKNPKARDKLVEKVSLASVVNWQIEQYANLAQSRGVMIKLEREDDVVVQAIPTVVNVLVSNIIRNAINYTDHNEIIIVLADSSVVIQDHGPGISQSDQQTIFERFERGTNDLKEGAGIGLWLVRRFCEEFEWAFHFESDESSGTRVAIRF